MRPDVPAHSRRQRRLGPRPGRPGVECGGASLGKGPTTTAAHGHDDQFRTRKISAASGRTENLVDIGVDRDGTAYLAYNAVDNNGHLALGARAWKRGGALGTAHRIAPSAHVVVGATSRTDLGGDTMVTWSLQAPGTHVPMLYGRIWRDNGTLGKVHKLGSIQPADTNQMVPSPAPQLAVDDGDGVVSWPTRAGRHPRRSSAARSHHHVRGTAAPHRPLTSQPWAAPRRDWANRQLRGRRCC